MVAVVDKSIYLNVKIVSGFVFFVNIYYVVIKFVHRGYYQFVHIYYRFVHTPIVFVQWAVVLLEASWFSGSFTFIHISQFIKWIQAFKYSRYIAYIYGYMGRINSSMCGTEVVIFSNMSGLKISVYTRE